MRATVLYGPRDVRFEDQEFPKIVEPTDAIIRITLTCVCGSDLRASAYQTLLRARTSARKAGL